MDIAFSRTVTLRPRTSLDPATFEEWRRALRGIVVAPETVRMSEIAVPAELPALPESEARASFEQVRRLLARGVGEPTLTQKNVEEIPFRDQFALWNEAPSRIEVFLSRYHNQTFAAFAVVAVLLLWII